MLDKYKIGPKGIPGPDENGNFVKPIFNRQLHIKVWEYIANIYLPKHEAIVDMSYNKLLTPHEEYELLSAHHGTLACQYALEVINYNKNSEELKEFWTASCSLPICFKYCPFEIKKDINTHIQNKDQRYLDLSNCFDGLYHEYMNLYDYEDDSPIILNKQLWKEICLKIANFKIKDNVITN